MGGEPISLFTIPSGENFVDALAKGLLAECPDPIVLSRTLILLPTSRACRALAEAFLRAGDGKALLLPRMAPLGDVDVDEFDFHDDEGGGGLDLPPAAPPLRRQLLLASLVLKLGAVRGGEKPSPEQAVTLAASLAKLLDEVHIAGVSFDALADLAPQELAAHWEITLEFLKIVTAHWPALMEQEGWMDRALRRRALMERRADLWEKNPPAFPIIAAGSTGSMPTTARLLQIVAGLPQGRVILPGLDRILDEQIWLDLPPTHPQYNLSRLLARMEVVRDQVQEWPRCADSPRARLISEALRPDGVSADWRSRDALSATERDEVLGGLTRLDCQTPAEEAGAITLMMRETLNHPGKRAALVTPDRSLARRVAADLRRFDIEIDDSAGRSLAFCPIGAFLLLLARMVASGFAPYDVLAALKHPLAAGGLPLADFHRKVRRLEILTLRGSRPAAGIEGLKAVLVQSRTSEDEKRDILQWLETIRSAGADLIELARRPALSLKDLVEAHIVFAENLAASDVETGPERLWAGDDGEAAALFLAELRETADALGAVRIVDYPGLLQALMAPIMVRSAWGSHPRLAIWGVLEARLQSSDLLILGGLNEGVWPADSAADPWMSRPMREAFGLVSPEMRIGLAAYDFEQAVNAPEVALTRSIRADGSPTVPSRWLLRLDAALQAAGVKNPWKSSDWIVWRQRLDQPAEKIEIAPPAPRPPVSARPRQLSATAIETWMRDPYAIYAKYILALAALDPVDADPAAADFGSVVHAVLHQFSSQHRKGPLPPESLSILEGLADREFAALQSRPGLAALWRPRFSSILEWFVRTESERRLKIAESWSEIRGKIVIDAPAGPFALTAIADRIDRLKDGGLAILDYKTGIIPTAVAVAAGFSPQLPIEALIAQKGGFDGVPKAEIAEMLYWKLSGGSDGGKQVSAVAKGEDPKDLAEEALDGVTRLVEAFDDEATSYVARPHPKYAPRYSDYTHLARIREWSVLEDGDEE